MQPVQFNLTIGVIKISMVENASAVNIGKNLLLDWESNTKTNQGLGNISGDGNALEKLANRLDDPDKIDFFNEQDSESLDPESLQKLVEYFFEEESLDEPND